MTIAMSEERLQEIETRARAATQGDLRGCFDHEALFLELPDSPPIAATVAMGGVIASFPLDCSGEGDYETWNRQARKNFNFFDRGRQDALDLLAEIRRLRSEADDLRTALEKATPPTIHLANGEQVEHNGVVSVHIGFISRSRESIHRERKLRK